MAESSILINGRSDNESDEQLGGVEAKRKRIQFSRAASTDSAEAFGDTGRTSAPRKPRGIPKEKRAEVTIGDTRAEVSNSVKGKPPTLPADDNEPTPRRGRPSKRLKPTTEDSLNTSKFLLSAIEIACVTSFGPAGEMSEWERGLMQAPLQRIIARTPLSVVEKGGMFIDCGFLIVGSGIYFNRLLKGVKLPNFAKNKKDEVATDAQAPISARVDDLVDTTRAGDKDGLAVPIPNVITANMNGVI